MNRLLCKLSSVAAAVIGMLCFAEDVANPMSDGEQAVIKAFFADFKDAFNAKDVDRVKKMSGDTWKQWQEAMNDDGRFDALEVLSITAGKQTNAVVNCTIVATSGRANSGEVVFTMKCVGGIYSIDKTTDPGGESRNNEFKGACRTLMQLITSINNCSMESVKTTVSFADALDFDSELTARGLSWIKDAVDNDVKISQKGIGVSREGKDIISGLIYVPDVLGGTNILRKVMFKGSKIDRATPREETTEEFLRRFEKEKAERRRQFEKERAERERKQNEEALKQLQKWMK